MNIKSFMKKYNNIYNEMYNLITDYQEKIYNIGDYTLSVSDLSYLFDCLVKDNKEVKDYLNRYIKYNHDYISSDREAAAFILTMFNLNIITVE